MIRLEHHNLAVAQLFVNVLLPGLGLANKIFEMPGIVQLASLFMDASTFHNRAESLKWPRQTLLENEV